MPCVNSQLFVSNLYGCPQSCISGRMQCTFSDQNCKRCGFYAILVHFLTLLIFQHCHLPRNETEGEDERGIRDSGLSQRLALGTGTLMWAGTSRVETKNTNLAKLSLARCAHLYTKPGARPRGCSPLQAGELPRSFARGVWRGAARAVTRLFLLCAGCETRAGRTTFSPSFGRTSGTSRS